jgi:DNA-binding response OmpR family regulator
MKAQSVLVVEDDQAVCKMLKRFLRLEGYAVQTAATWEEALVCFKAHSPNLVLMDYDLPGGNGLDLAGELRNLKHDAKIMLITGNASPRVQRRARDMGVDYAPKPIEMSKLLSWTRQLGCGLLACLAQFALPPL